MKKCFQFFSKLLISGHTSRSRPPFISTSFVQAFRCFFFENTHVASRNTQVEARPPTVGSHTQGKQRCPSLSQHCACTSIAAASECAPKQTICSLPDDDMPNSAVSSIFSIPPYFELGESPTPSNTPAPTDNTAESFATALQLSAPPSSPPSSTTHQPPPTDPFQLSTLVAAVQQERRPVKTTGPNTGNSLAVNQLSPDLIRALSQSDGALNQLRHAISGSDSNGRAMGPYWCSLWCDLHVTSDNCVFLDNRIVLPDSLRTPFLSYLHSTHAGAKAMLEMAQYVGSPTCTRLFNPWPNTAQPGNASLRTYPVHLLSNYPLPAQR